MKKFILGLFIGLLLASSGTLLFFSKQISTETFHLLNDGVQSEEEVVHYRGKSYIDTDIISKMDIGKVNLEAKSIEINKSMTKTNETKINETVNLIYVKEHLKQGITKEEVQKYFGNSFVEYTSDNDGSTMWRIDYPMKNDYMFDPVAKGRGQGEVDMKGLISGDMKAQIYISYTDNKVKRFVAFIHENGKVKEYRILADGSIREE